jgi:hypothetical protein
MEAPGGDGRERFMEGLRETDSTLWYDRIAFVPSIHGRAAFAREVRRVFLSGRFPTVAVELPESLAERTIEGIDHLPAIHVVSYEEATGARAFFPIDPCDSIIEALRLGAGENCDLEFIDMDVEEFERTEVVLPDPYAAASIGLPRFYRAIEPALPEVVPGSQDDIREAFMARRLQRLLARDPRRLPILCVLGMVHLRGVVRRLVELSRSGGEAEDVRGAPPPFDVTLHPVSRRSLYHILGELPYTTHLYEKQRGEISLDEFDAVEKLKELLLEARERYHEKHKEEYERISAASFQNLLQLIRNLCLLGKRLTPMLYEMAVAAKGIAGSEFAVQVIETAKRYPLPGREPRGSIQMTEEAMRLSQGPQPAKKRFVDEAKVWKSLKLKAPPPEKDRKRWRTAWNPLQSCSWTPEDVLIENFAGHVRARALLESGLAEERLEEFRTSFKDGIHVRETIRNLHLGKVIVKEVPQIVGQVGAVIVIYERPDPEKFPWKITWMPEFAWESVLAFYATSYLDDLVGPGIARATYGGQLFVRPRGFIGDIWDRDSTLDEARDDAERLVFAGAIHSPDRFLAYVAASQPTSRMKEFARRAGKRIIYLPLSGFSRSTLEKLRRFHVLNGKPVRSWARQFIR